MRASLTRLSGIRQSRVMVPKKKQLNGKNDTKQGTIRLALVNCFGIKCAISKIDKHLNQDLEVGCSKAH